MRLALAILFASVLASFGAGPYYVLLTGSDASNGTSWASAKRTISNAVSVASTGDTIYLGAGDFAEYVPIETPDHTLKIISESNAVTRSFWFKTGSNELHGITLSHCNESGWGAIPKNGFLRIDQDAHNTVVSNCNFINQPWIASTNWRFNPGGNNTITNVGSVDLLTAGFSNGSHIYINGVSYSNAFRGGNWRFDNQSKTMIATTVTATAFQIANGSLVAESNDTNVWAIVQAGTSPYLMNAINFTVAGGYAAGNCLISGCLFSNLLGVCISASTHDLMVTNCEFTAIYGQSFITFGGYNLYIVSNYFHDCPQIAYYGEMDAVQHEGGPGFYDYYVASIKGSGDYAAGNSNVWFMGNWMENIHTDGIDLPHSQPDPGDFHHYNIIGNVFVGVAGDIGGGGDYTYINSNTFYRCIYRSADTGGAASFGASPDYTYTNSTAEFTYNVMVSCGGHKTPDSEGGFTIVQTTDTLTHSNFIAGTSVKNWNAMATDYFTATNGVNGGNPYFRDEFRPRGLDGIPFTADDGLRPIPRSPILGRGALAMSASTTTPIPYFRPVGLVSNYWDYKETNYNPGWQTNMWVFERTSWDRGWYYGDALTNLPQTIVFDATNSISGTWSTNDWVGIKDFVWDFGDGSRAIWTKWPRVEHTFLTTGQFAVTLTVTNSATNSASHTRNYRILPGTNFAGDVFYVSTNSVGGTGTYGDPYRYVTQAIHVATAGDYICVLPGRYTNEQIWPGDTFGTDGTAANRITLAAYSAVSSEIKNKVSYWTIEGFEFAPTSDVQNGVIWVPEPELYLTFRNLYLPQGRFSQDFIYMQNSGGLGSRDSRIYNCTIIEVSGNDGVFDILNASNTYVAENIIINSQWESDIRVDSDGATIARNYYYGLAYTNGSHSDFIAYMGSASTKLRNYTIEQNWFEMPTLAYQYTLAKTNAAVSFSDIPDNGNSVTINSYTRYFTNNTPADGDVWIRVGTNSTTTRNNFYTNGIDNPWESGWIVKFSETDAGAVHVRGNPLQVMAVSDVGANLSTSLIYEHSMPTALGNAGTEFIGDATYSNFVFRNNVFLNVYTGFNPVKGDGLKFYNNLFANIQKAGGDSIVFGAGSGGSTYGADFRNNIWFQCGSSTNNGWYRNGSFADDKALTNGSIDHADYNFVCYTNYLAVEPWTDGETEDQYPYLWGIPFLAAHSITALAPVYDQPGQETNGINGVNPLFASEDANDFRLQAASPLLGQGVDLSATGFDYDFFGRPRPAAWSIGPFESVDFAEGGGGGATNTVKKATLRGSKVVLRGKVTLR